MNVLQDDVGCQLQDDVGCQLQVALTCQSSLHANISQV